MNQLDADHDRARADWTTENRARREAAMAVHDCPECGSPVGMAVLVRDGLTAEMLARYALYRRPDASDHEIYAPCSECNALGRVPGGYHAVDMTWVRDWLARRCMCRECQMGRMDNAAPADSSPWRGSERMFR